jgi:hypothetical protein
MFVRGTSVIREMFHRSCAGATLHSANGKVLGGANSLILERETGVEPATSSLGKWAMFCFQ